MSDQEDKGTKTKAKLVSCFCAVRLHCLLSIYFFICLGAVVENYCVFRSTQELLPTKTVDVSNDGWEQLRKGMSHEQVTTLLGEPGVKHAPTRLEGFRTLEVWEYAWKLPQTGQGTTVYSDKVFFDEAGRLQRWRLADSFVPLWRRLRLRPAPTAWWLESTAHIGIAKWTAILFPILFPVWAFFRYTHSRKYQGREECNSPKENRSP